MHKLAQLVLGFIRKHDLLRPGDRVGVAVSGGADSVALLRILLELRPELGVVLSVIHLNHKLRDVESETDEHFVRELASAYRLPFICESVDVKAYAAEKKLSLETSARDLRYQFFAAALKDANLDKIATAHTLDDQAETVLLKLARGAGTKGLGGIYPNIRLHDSAQGTHKNKAIVRPLLASQRQDIEAYLREIKQTWREDSSNRELRHTRNRLRHEILPRLQEQLNPRIRESLAEAAEIARCEEEYWSREMVRLLQIWRSTSKGSNLSHTSMAQLELAVQRRIVRAIGESLGLHLEFRHVEEILALSQEGASIALPHGWSAVLSKGKICFKPRSNEPQCYEYALPVPGTVEIPEADAVIKTASLCQKDSRYATERLLDKQFTTKGLVVRNWRPGDRFWPPNSKAPKKIKELLQERHLTGDEKKNWPVVASANEVVWVRGFGVRRDYQAKDSEGVLITASALEA